MKMSAPFQFLDIARVAARFEDTSPTRWYWRALYVIVVTPALIGAVKLLARAVTP